jgi:DNA polymerase I-like protein with 3'-5' exonuclease and polymerase domains
MEGLDLPENDDLIKVMQDKRYVVVRSEEELIEMVEHIKKWDLISFDTETTTLNPRKGRIVGISVSAEIGVGYYLPILVYENNELQPYYISEVSCFDLAKRVIRLLSSKKIIGHNLSFDTRYVKCEYGIDLVPSIYADTVLLVHTVSEEGVGEAVGSFALKEIAKAIQDKIGLDMEKEANQEQIELKESIKYNGGFTTKENYEIYKADLAILGKYACADTDLTLRVFNYYKEILSTEGLDKFFFEDEVMPLYKEVTIPMESNGVKLDLDLMQKAREEILTDLENYKKLVITGLLSFTEVKEWVIAKALEEFPVSNKGRFAQELVKKSGQNFPVSSKTGKYLINAANVNLYAEEPLKSFLSTGDATLLDENYVLSVSVGLWKESQNGDYFNIQSKDHMGSIAFDALGMKPLSETEKGKAKFDEDFIQSISSKHSWAKNLRIYNKLLKIKSTYIDRFLDKQEDGLYYFYYKQHATVSGRYGSDAQQLPRPKEEGDDDPIIIRYTNMIRAFFISKPGNIFIDCDYSSLEPRVFAHVSGDSNLKKIFADSLDFYSYIAIQTEKLSGVSANPKDANFLKKVSPSKRQSAKAYSLGIAYGLKAYALSKTLDVPIKEAEKLINGYLEGFPELANWMRSTEAFVKSNGYVKVETGRIRHLPKVPYLYKKFGDGLLDWKTRGIIEKSLGKELVLSMVRDFKNGVNASFNVQIQALAASIVNRAAIKINREFKKVGIKGLVVANIHDQLIMEVCESRTEDAKRIVQECMENTTLLNGVSLVAIPEIAKNLRDGH